MHAYAGTFMWVYLVYQQFKCVDPILPGKLPCRREASRELLECLGRVRFFSFQKHNGLVGASTIPPLN
jgi:hypothetical protein